MSAGDRLKRCPSEECHELIPLDAVDCGKHWHHNPHKCLDCDTIVYGQLLRCATCRVKLHRASLNEYREKWIKAEDPIIKPWVPRPKPKPLLTDAQQRAIDRQIDQIRLAQSGLLHRDQGRSLSREEIESLQRRGEITPIHLIPHREAVDNVWSGYF